jgi:hypothetical protein
MMAGQQKPPSASAVGGPRSRRHELPDLRLRPARAGDAVAGAVLLLLEGSKYDYACSPAKRTPTAASFTAWHPRLGGRCRSVPDCPPFRNRADRSGVTNQDDA